MSDDPNPELPASSPLRVLLVDDHALFLEGLKNLLTGRGVEVVGTARNGLEALEKARQFSPEIILMDIRMPGCDGLTATRLIKAEMPQIKIIMLTTSTADTDLFEAIRSGACGYLLKSLETKPFLTYLEGVARGEAAISRELAGYMLEELARRPETSEPKAAPNQAAQFTPRQTEILQWVAQGLPYKEVAERLCVSEHTVKYHMGEILQRLHLKNRDEVMAYALRTGLFRSAKSES